MKSEVPKVVGAPVLLFVGPVVGCGTGASSGPRIQSEGSVGMYEVSGAHAVAGDETTARAGAAWG
jgi:hypothetical protein